MLPSSDIPSQQSAPDHLLTSALLAALTPQCERAARLAARVTQAAVAWVEWTDASRRFICAGHALTADPAAYLALSQPYQPLDGPRAVATLGAVDQTDTGLQSLLMLPLTVDTTSTVGTLVVADHQPRDWSPQDTAALADIAEMLRGHVSAEVRRVRYAVLRAEYDELQTLIKSGPIVILRWQHEDEWRILYASPNLADHFGHDAAAIVQTQVPYRSLIHSEDVERVVQETQDCLRANIDSFHQQYRLRHADGSYRYVNEHTILIRDAEGRPQYYLGYIHDISEQKEIEDALRQTTARLQSLLESDTAYMVRTDIEGRFTFVNQNFKALIERAYKRQDDLLGTDSMQTVVPEDHELTFETVRACIEQPGQPYQVILRKPNPDGGHFYTLWEFVGVRGEGGAAVEIQCVGFDITPLMVVTQELTRREELYRFIFENTMDSISLYDGSGRLLLGNEVPAFEAVHTLAERMQMTSDDQLAYVHPDDVERILHEYRECTQAQQPSGVYVYRLRQRDGSYLWVENHARYIYDDGGTLNKIISVRRDITERVQAQEALRHTNALLQSIIDSEAVYIVRTDLEARFTFVNERFRKLIAQAYPALGEIIGTNSMETIVPEDHPKTLDTVARCIQAPGMPHQIVLRKAHPDGGFYYTLWEFTGVPDATGSTAEIQCVGFDITELTRAQQTLQEQDQRYRFIVENSLDAVTLHAPDGRILAIGSGIDFFEDYTPDELMAMSAEQLADFIHPDDLPRVRAEQAAYLAAGIETASYTYRMLRRDGSAFWVENRVRYLRGADGQLTGIVAINRNIDALVQAQEALRQSEARYRTLTQMMSDFVFEVSFTGEDRVEVRWLEGNYEGVTGYPLETAVKTLEKIEIHPDDLERRRVDMQRTREGMFTSTEYRLKHLHGHYVWARISRLPIVDPQTNQVIGYYGVAQDISAERNEKALREEQERLSANLRREEAFNQTIRRVVSAISHDVRTPLAVIATSKDLLERYADRLSTERRRAAFETIEQQLQYISRMLEDLSKVIKGTLIEGSLQLSAVDLETLCRVTIDQLQQTIGQRHRLRFEPDWQGPVLIDETLVNRILFNLLSNAVKFSAPGSVVTLRLKQQQRLIVLQVSDEGIGIPLEEQSKVFDMFYRAENAQNTEGTGLGLSIVKECVERHAGQIYVDSQLGRGTTFTIELPLLAETSSRSRQASS